MQLKAKAEEEKIYENHRSLEAEAKRLKEILESEHTMNSELIRNQNEALKREKEKIQKAYEEATEMAKQVEAEENKIRNEQHRLTEEEKKIEAERINKNEIIRKQNEDFERETQRMKNYYNEMMKKQQEMNEHLRAQEQKLRNEHLRLTEAEKIVEAELIQKEEFIRKHNEDLKREKEKIQQEFVEMTAKQQVMKQQLLAQEQTLRNENYRLTEEEKTLEAERIQKEQLIRKQNEDLQREKEKIQKAFEEMKAQQQAWQQHLHATEHNLQSESHRLTEEEKNLEAERIIKSEQLRLKNDELKREHDAIHMLYEEAKAKHHEMTKEIKAKDEILLNEQRRLAEEFEKLGNQERRLITQPQFNVEEDISWNDERFNGTAIEGKRVKFRSQMHQQIVFSSPFQDNEEGEFVNVGIRNRKNNHVVINSNGKRREVSPVPWLPVQDDHTRDLWSPEKITEIPYEQGESPTVAGIVSNAIGTAYNLFRSPSWNADTKATQQRSNPFNRIDDDVEMN